MLSGPRQGWRAKSHSHISCTVASCHPCSDTCKEQARVHRDPQVHRFALGVARTKVGLGQHYLLKASLGWAEVTIRIW